MGDPWPLVVKMKKILVQKFICVGAPEGGTEALAPCNLLGKDSNTCAHSPMLWSKFLWSQKTMFNHIFVIKKLRASKAFAPWTSIRLSIIVVPIL